MHRQRTSWGNLAQDEVLSQEERRRQQNREAQRNYRRRVKQRLDALKQYETGVAVPLDVYTHVNRSANFVQDTPTPSSTEWDLGSTVGTPWSQSGTQNSLTLCNKSQQPDPSLAASTSMSTSSTISAQQTSSTDLFADFTPLHRSIANGHSRLAGLLIKNGADLEAVTSAGQTPLQIAAMMGQIDCVDMLVDYGCNLNHQDQMNQTALHLAVQNMHVPIVERLVHEGAALEFADLGGLTPLHHAAAGGNEEVLAYLLNAGANVHSRSGPRAMLRRHIPPYQEAVDLIPTQYDMEWLNLARFPPTGSTGNT